MPLAKITVDENYQVAGTGDTTYPGPLSDEEKSHGYLTASNVANRLIMTDGWDWDLSLSYCRLYWRYDIETKKPLPCLQLKFTPRPGVAEKIQEIEIRIETDTRRSECCPNYPTSLATWIIGQIPDKVAEGCDRRSTFWLEQSAKIPFRSPK